MPLGAALDWAAGCLAAAGVDQPRREARLLAAHLLGAARAALLDRASRIDGPAYAALVARRAAREPLAFITGRRGFWTLDLEVSPDTLVPRPDSETLVQAALAHAPGARRVLDLGTGTGCLLLAVLAECPAAFGVGVDLSPAACRLAARNAAANGLADRCAFVAGDWAAALHGRFDVVLCNPPYIESAALARPDARGAAVRAGAGAGWRAGGPGRLSPPVTQPRATSGGGRRGGAGGGRRAGCGGARACGAIRSGPSGNQAGPGWRCPRFGNRA